MEQAEASGVNANDVDVGVRSFEEAKNTLYGTITAAAGLEKASRFGGLHISYLCEHQYDRTALESEKVAETLIGQLHVCCISWGCR